LQQNVKKIKEDWILEFKGTRIQTEIT